MLGTISSCGCRKSKADRYRAAILPPSFSGAWIPAFLTELRSRLGFRLPCLYWATVPKVVGSNPTPATKASGAGDSLQLFCYETALRLILFTGERFYFLGLFFRCTASFRFEGINQGICSPACSTNHRNVLIAFSIADSPSWVFATICSCSLPIS